MNTENDTIEPKVQLDLKAIGRAAAREAERTAISDVLESVRWNRVKAAKILQISYRALLYKIKDYGLKESGQQTT